MPEGEYDTRAELLKTLLAKVENDPYPSCTMLDLIEALLTPDDVPDYAEALLDRIREDEFPSISMIQRVHSLS